LLPRRHSRAGLAPDLAHRLGIVFDLGLRGVWAAMIVDMVARASLLALRFRGGAWKWISV
jgi:Na+-driven multidrug efflux pump